MDADQATDGLESVGVSPPVTAELPYTSVGTVAGSIVSLNTTVTAKLAGPASRSVNSGSLAATLWTDGGWASCKWTVYSGALPRLMSSVWVCV